MLEKRRSDSDVGVRKLLSLFLEPSSRTLGSDHNQRKKTHPWTASSGSALPWKGQRDFPRSCSLKSMMFGPVRPREAPMGAMREG